jgi:hypothetical protein
MKCTFLSCEREKSVPKYEFKFNGGLATAENWHLKECMLKVNVL